MSALLRLEVVDYAGPAHWHWILTSAEGGFIAENEVRLDPSDWQFEALTDLAGYLSWHVAPDRRGEEEERLLHEIGTWIAAEMLGPVGPAIVSYGPATVQLVVPRDLGDADQLLFAPLELARIAGRPLGLSRVSFVRQATTPGRTSPARPQERVRMLGVFSLPADGQPLNLRRERQALVTLTRYMSATGKAADVRVLQYGVTREALREALGDPEGWDIVHVSGHGAPGELLLEAADGSKDPVDATDLVSVLEPARDRVSLVTLSACRSAARIAADRRRLLGLPLAEDPPPERANPYGRYPGSGPLASELASRLGCAVLAMRYPVDDEFAVTFFTGLYRRLIGRGQPLPDVIPLVLHEMTRKQERHGFDFLSTSSPVLFGAGALDLRLAAPVRDPENYDPSRVKMAGFPAQGDRFVGRTRLMAEASAALAERSGRSGVLLCGMPGTGKTACALELAYGHEHAFDLLAWYKAPDEGSDIAGSLTDFALTLERYLPGFQMIHTLADEGALDLFLPALAELMERSRLLIVIDNAESLVAEGGQWHDGAWGRVVGALAAHTGLGRLIMTSRWAPAKLSAMATLPVDALSLDEALLLVSELPQLRALISGDIPGLDRPESRRLARGVLSIAQGHPKLLELADGQAADPARLAQLVLAVGEAEHVPDGLQEPAITGWDDAPSPSDYVRVLTGWTTTVADTLPLREQRAFWLLCCLEEPDRVGMVIHAIWPRLWRRLSPDEEPPKIEQALATIVARGLASAQRDAHDEDDAGDEATSYGVHASSAAAGRELAGPAFRDLVDAEAAAWWSDAYQHASGEENGEVRTGLLVRAGLAAVPYLTRQQDWDKAGDLLKRAFNRDPSRANAAAMLPAIRQIARHAAYHEATVAQLLEVLDPAAGEEQTRAALAAALDRADYRVAAAVAIRLAERCRQTGRLSEALSLTEDAIGYTRQGGLGPWTQLADEVQRLQVLAEMGEAADVLAEVVRLRAYMDTLPPSQDPETAPPWSVREALLDVGRYAAIGLGQWEDAIDLGGSIAVSQHGRAAPAASTALTRFNDYYPLLRLGRTDKALALLQECLTAFQDSRDTRMIGKALGALASIEASRGHGEAALRLQRDALRYHYLVGDVTAIAASYDNLGNYLARHVGHPAQALASHLAAALISAVTGIATSAVDSVQRAVTDLRELGNTASPPASVADLDRQLGDIPGTDLPGLLAMLTPALESADAALRDLVARGVATVAKTPGAFSSIPRRPSRGPDEDDRGE